MLQRAHAVQQQCGEEKGVLVVNISISDNTGQSGNGGAGERPQQTLANLQVYVCVRVCVLVNM